MKIIKKKVPVTVYEERTVGFEVGAYPKRITHNHSMEHYNYYPSTSFECQMKFVCNGQEIEVDFILEDGPDPHMIRELFCRDSFGLGWSSATRPPKFKISVEKEEIFEKKRNECRRKDLPKDSL